MNWQGTLGSDREQTSLASSEYAFNPYLSNQKSAEGLRPFYDDPANRAQLIEAMDRMISAHRIALLSIDVFDTALLRSPGSELGRFWSLSKRFHMALLKGPAGPDVTAEDVLLARITAMRAAYAMQRHSIDGRDPRLDDIARTVCALLNRPDLTGLYLQTELDCEIRDVSLNPLIPEIRKRFPSLRIVFLSDMYIDSRRIGRILKAKLPSASLPVIFSSADGQGSKSAGGLFDHVARLSGVKPGNALHIGDNLEHDYRGAKRRGWHALYLPLPDAERRNRRNSFARIRSEIIAWMVASAMNAGLRHDRI